MDRIFPEENLHLRVGDMLLVLDESQECEKEGRQRPREPQRLVIVDDNPVIVKLYTRLFQKAGFTPLWAASGQDGLDLIIREKPVAAVIDYMMPGLSGIDICKKIREGGDCRDTRLILFTADDQPETRKRALEAGAEAVVVKSPEAGEVIETVIRILEHEEKTV
jgi:DNA-binding response OmpR family regulator